MGYNEKRHGAYNLALIFGNQKLVLWGKPLFVISGVQLIPARRLMSFFFDSRS